MEIKPQGIAFNQKSTPAPIFLEYLNGHRMRQPPNHLNWALRLIAHKSGETQVREWRGYVVHFLSGTYEEEHGVAALLMANEILARLAD